MIGTIRFDKDYHEACKEIEGSNVREGETLAYTIKGLDGSEGEIMVCRFGGVGYEPVTLVVEQETGRGGTNVLRVMGPRHTLYENKNKLEKLTGGRMELSRN